MNKKNINKLSIDFHEEIDSLLTFYSETVPAIGKRLASGGSPGYDSHNSVLAEVVFHRGFVAVESFLSDWFIACINHNPSAYLKWRETAINNSVEDRFGKWYVEHFLTYRRLTHLKQSVIEELVNPEGENVTFSYHDQLKQRASDWLSPEWNSKVASVDKNRLLILDGAKKIRNRIAHNSRRSLTEMNDALKSLLKRGNALLLRPEKNSIKKVGSYLKAKPKNDRTRLQIFFEEFKGFADDLNGT